VDGGGRGLSRDGNRARGSSSSSPELIAPSHLEAGPCSRHPRGTGPARICALLARTSPVRFTAFAFALFLASATTACPGDDPTPSGGCVDYAPPASFVASTPATSLSRDVMPIFQRSCAFSTCHGSNVGPANGVFLGNDAARVHAAVVNVKSGELPAMPFVTPGDPRQSYLMRKMDGSQCALDGQCTGGSCKDSMPKNDDVLPLETRDIVRRWIAQGAKND